MTLATRWAMMIVVVPFACRRSALRRFSSVRKSRALVASSRMSMGAFLSRLLAMDTRCR